MNLYWMFILGNVFELIWFFGIDTHAKERCIYFKTTSDDIIKNQHGINRKNISMTVLLPIVCSGLPTMVSDSVIWPTFRRPCLYGFPLST